MVVINVSLYIAALAYTTVMVALYDLVLRCAGNRVTSVSL